MKHLYNCEQIRSLDALAVNELNYPSLLLMENAVMSVLASAKDFVKEGLEGKKAAVACGRGNNGGDGLALARHLYLEGAFVRVYLTGTGSALTQDTETNLRILQSISEKTDNLKIFYVQEEFTASLTADQPDIIFDALLGSGAKGSLKEPYLSLAETLNKINCVKIAVDIPTGLNADTGSSENYFEADLTITLGELKPGLFVGRGLSAAGIVVKGSIGVPEFLTERFTPVAYIPEKTDIAAAVPVKKRNINKYTAGRVTVLSGSADYPGAAILTSKALLLSGAGSPFHFVPVKIKNYLVNAVPEVVTVPYEPEQLYDQESRDLFIGHASKSGAVLIGPGLGRSTEVTEFVKKMLSRLAGMNVILDADGLAPLGDGRYRNYDLKGFILTPHEGEFSKLLGITTDELLTDPLKYGKKFVKETGAGLILKGASMIFFSGDGEKVYINATGNSGLAKFGSGDVFAGLLASFISQSRSIEPAPVNAAMYIFGAAADKLASEKGVHGFTAGETAEAIPFVIKEILTGKQ
ncbi:MAG: NAD(P)H-hydrate dehydratase [Ignavibacteriaceae bacterium]|nr:NAD(P)H-hydrate dehydratase [Ignavibacteriaceae bacterium]